MQAAPKFIFEDGFFLYHGGVNRNELHSNAAYQLAISSASDIHISDKEEQDTVGSIILVKPLVKHKILCDGAVSLIYLSPKLNWALSFLKNIAASNNITALDDNLLPFNKTDSLEQIATALKNQASSPKIELDPRLSAAIEDLSANLSNASILQTAQRCNLSRSRLRALAREQIGMPLSTWLTWRKIVEANKALAKGTSLSEAAFIGGFSDQAHFTRTMRRMFGVTPTHALKVYN